MAVREVKLQISASASEADQARQKLVTGFQQAAQQINRSFNSINKLDGLRANIAATGSQLDRLRDELRGVADEILRTGNNGARLEALKAQYRGLQTEIGGVERGLTKSQEQARALEASLRAAGVSTTQFGAARAQIEGMAAALGKAQAEMQAIRRNAQNLFGGIGDVGRAQAAIQSEIAALRQRNALIGANTELERLERGIVLGNYAAYTSAQLTQLRLLAAEYDQKQALLRVERERAAAAAAQRANLGNFAQGALSVGGFGFGLGAVGAGIAAAGTAAFSSQQALEFERAQAAITAVTGSLAQARAEMGFVREQANRLGVSVTDMARSWAQLQAASKGSALEGQAARDVFLAVSEAAQRLNLRTFETEGALRAIGQMMSKGTVQAEELRGQLGDRLPGAFNIMARALGVTTAELGEMLKKGQVLSGEALPKFAEELRKTFGTDATTRIDTTAAAFNRLVNEIKLTAAAVGEVLNPALKEGSNVLSDILVIAREKPIFTSMFAMAPGLLPVFRGMADELRNVEKEANAVRAALDRIATAPAFDARTAAQATVDGLVNFDPFAKRPQNTFYGPGTPSRNNITGVDLLTSGVTPVDQENLAKLREKIGLLEQTTELAKVEWSIRNGELATVSKVEQAEARRLAILQDRINAEKAAKKDDKKSDRALLDAEKLFKDNVETEARRIKEQGELRRRLNIETLEAQGKDTQAALAQISDQYAEFQRQLADSAEGLDLAKKWFNANEAAIALRGIQKEVEKAVSDLQARVQGRDLRAVTASPTERDRLQAENMADVLGTQAAIEQLRQNAELFGGSQNEGFTGAMNAATASVRNLGEEIRRQAEGPIARLFRDWSDWTSAAEQAGARWIESTVDGIARMAAGGKADFRSLAESIIEDIIRIQLQALAANIASGGIGQAVGGFFAGLFGGGGAGAIDWANQTATGPVVYKAGGGYISGPGTGTSDSIPAMLSNGEFVINARAVRMFGRGLFEDMNRGSPPSAVRRYAEGGYVGRGGMPVMGGMKVEIINNTGAEVRTQQTREGGVDITRIVVGVIESDMAQNGPLSRKLQRNFGLTPVTTRR